MPAAKSSDATTDLSLLGSKVIFLVCHGLAGSSKTWSQTPKTDFLVTRPTWYMQASK